ncbi:MAG: efflux RND transporter periplasmic adaptor subunit [Dysgonamonadaceae bacterium]|jgi:RND family efflux transporter MFP subunit|nr:efflux RND transporter periplasmic adaptor subunit [Dysgonamonadaceae bacterium]MDD3355762.1 efflux RND transporter periplasmic adaptor subunit [Dysgonamonadaceae bacterium]MDD3727282.1 efflux RND transporter periplasmic adaptor subunit [Dysgonamonadaceae bacterium]
MKFYLIILSVLLLAACGGKEEPEEQIRPVFYQKVEKQSVSEIRSFAGISQPNNEAKLSFRVGGNIEQITVELGDSLKRGQVIARLDNTDYRINYNKAVMSQKNAQVQLIAAKSSYQRVESLYANNSASLSDFEKSKAQYESALAMASSANAQVEAAKNQLDYTLLRAPYDGTITAIMADENEMVGAGQPIAAFSSTSNIEVRSAVPENVVGRVSRGQKVTVSFGSLPDQLYNGTISEMSTGTDNTSTYAVIVKLTGQMGNLLPGMTGTVNIPLMATNESLKAVIVPTDAVNHDADGDFVYVALQSEKPDIYVATRREVTTGELTPLGYSVTEGLSEGDIVITAGLSSLYDGRRVKLLNINE